MRVVLAALAIAVFAMVGIMGINATLIDGGDRFDVEGEQWAPDPGNITVLEFSELDIATYDETVTVTRDNDAVMTEGEDYEWFAHNGTVMALEGGQLQNDDTANITYGYERPTDEQMTMSDMMSTIPNAAGFLLPVFAFLFLLAIVRGR